MDISEILKLINEDFFLANNSEEIDTIISNGFITGDILKSRWLGYNGAGEDVIRNKEQELGVVLPQSYKEFLLVSNGFKILSPFLDNLNSVEKVNWAKQTEGQSWSRYENFQSNVSDRDYFDYSDQQDPVLCRDEYLFHCLKVSEWCFGMCVFLNPLVIHNGEWEVLEYATWYPGTMRYRSFKEYLLSIHKNNLKMLNDNGG